MSKIRVILADDHTIFREGIRRILEAEPDIEVIGEAADGWEALRDTQKLGPDIVLMDIGMPGLSGLEATHQIKQNCPFVQVLMLTMHEDDDYFFRSLKSGAAGYVPKRAASTELVAGIRAVTQGQVFLYPSVAQKLVADYLQRVQERQEPSSLDRLTAREREVLALVADGHTHKQVAELLVVSPNTVQSHCWKIMEKLNLHSRTELIKYAIRFGLVELDA